MASRIYQHQNSRDLPCQGQHRAWHHPARLMEAGEGKDGARLGGCPVSNSPQL